MRQKGFTLIELLVALAVGGLVMASALSIMYQVIWGTNRTTSQVVALTDVHYAASQLTRDIVMTQSTDLPPDGSTITLLPDGPTTTLTWTDYTSFEEEEDKNHSSAYNLLEDGKLQRTYDGITSIVGRNITSVEFTLNPDNDRIVNVVITATEGDMTPRSETLEFSVYLRGGGI